MSSTKKWAYFGIPHIGGTYSVFKLLRQGLAAHGIEVRWLGVGARHTEIVRSGQWDSELLLGEVAGPKETSDEAKARALIKHIEQSGYDGVFVNVLADRVSTNAIRYLDPAIRRIMIVHSITPGTYAAACAMRDHAHATVGVSSRIQSDLIHKHRFPFDRIYAIPTALKLDAFNLSRKVNRANSLRLLFLGRIMDSDKGVFWLPKIMEQLANYPIHLTIAGDGPDLAELQRRCAHLQHQVRFIGRVSPVAVPSLLAKHDVFIFPSRFEGLGLTLVEAMAAGCVPIASRIKGVTDYVIHEGEDGFLFAIGNTAAAAEAVLQLDQDRILLTQMSAAARANINGRFRISQMGQYYAEVLHQVMEKPVQVVPTIPFSQWKYPRGLQPGLRTYLPAALKNRLRAWRERLA